MIQVSAGIVYRQDGAILACKRGEGRSNAHLWEFPGGKREAGESAAACLQRELLEELHLPVSQPRQVCEADAQGIHFTFLTCTAQGQPVATEHEAIAFVPPRALLTLPFCPADTAVARALALNTPPLRHFFWDFDGTLMDTYPGMLHSLMEALAALGVRESAEHVLTLMKDNLRYAIRTLATQYDLPEQALFDAYLAQDAHMDRSAVRPIDGIPQAMQALAEKGGRHYLVTHRERDALTMLENAGLLDLFTGVVTAEDGFPRKPAPDSCLHLLRTHGIDPQEAVMIGDRPLDTAAGRAAGMLSCLLDEEERFPDDPCELRVHSAWELPAALCPSAID